MMPHLYQSEDAITQGQTVRAVCGKTVPNLRFRFSAQGDIAGFFKPTAEWFCHKCCLAYRPKGSEELLYGIYEFKAKRQTTNEDGE